MEEARTFYQRNLPHYQLPNGSFFVTFRLAGSLPKDAILYSKEERRPRELQTPKLRDEASRMNRRFGKFDALLDKAAYGPHWLGDDRIANIVAGAVQRRDGDEYDLIAYCLMPNHVHLVISLLLEEDVKRSGTSLCKILQSLKAYTAKEGNRILGRSGAFWQHESYDHVVRNGEELERIVWYVLNNPVKAGLAAEWNQWKWRYCKYKL